MICRECGAEMYLDDRDYNFKGNYDNYWCCSKCATSCLEEVRFGQSWRENWHTENGIIRDWIIKHKIERH